MDTSEGISTQHGADLNDDGLVHTLQTFANNQSLRTMSAHECVQNFAQLIVTNYSSVVLVTTTSRPEHEILNADRQTLTLPPGSSSGSMIWICSATNGDCNSVENQQQNVTWSVPTPSGDAPNSPPGYSIVDRCLAKEDLERCSVLFSRPLMIAVIICNVGKIACFVITLALLNFQPLITVGDAVASYLSRPDPNTTGLGPISCVDVREGRWRRKDGSLGLYSSVRPNAGYWSGDVHRWCKCHTLHGWLSNRVTYADLL